VVIFEKQHNDILGVTYVLPTSHDLAHSQECRYLWRFVCFYALFKKSLRSLFEHANW